MALNYDTATDLDTHLKILLFGLSGSGKSYAAAKAGGAPGSKEGRVAVLLLEPNGLASIRASNRHAIVVTAYDPKRYGKVDVWEVVEQFIRDAMDGTLAAAGVTTIVVDSLTELQRVWRDRCLVDDGVERKRLALHKMTQQQWGTWTERFRRVLRTFRDLPMNVVAVALVQNETDDDGNITAIVPAFEGKKLPNEVAQFFSAVGYCYKKEVPYTVGEGDTARTEKRIEHRVLFQTGGKLVVKPFPGLSASEEPDPKVWAAKYAASVAAGDAEPIAAAEAAAIEKAATDEPGAVAVNPVAEAKPTAEAAPAAVTPTASPRKKRATATEAEQAPAAK
jgi:hypothetical protein